MAALGRGLPLLLLLLLLAVSGAANAAAAPGGMSIITYNEEHGARGLERTEPEVRAMYDLCGQHLLLRVWLQERLLGLGLLPGRGRHLLQGSRQLLPAGLPCLQRQSWNLLGEQEQPTERQGLEAHSRQAEHRMRTSIWDCPLLFLTHGRSDHQEQDFIDYLYVCISTITVP
ncbi:putative cysteine protease RD21B [Zea mays]|uniref:Putative cysteine protease RD21B n=1 Tax=Zea mays TaxID=4577 RepID=A0A1D6JHL3_MAIZE|nr:putative cysteine protease RD21B [Zea mays]